MTAAVFLHNVTKTFRMPRVSLPRQPASLSGRSAAGFDLNSHFEGFTALDRVSFQVEEAEIFGVVGARGSGKSTLVRLLSGLLKPDEGEIRIFGCNVLRQPQQSQRWINRVSIEASFFKQLSTMENLVQAGRLYGINESETRQRAEAILARLDFDPVRQHLPMERLNRSELQKVSVVQALLARPRLLLLDEPCRGLDDGDRRAVRNLIRGLRSQHDTTVLLTSREVNEARYVCDRIAVLESGQIIALDEPEFLELSLTYHANQHMELSK